MYTILALVSVRAAWTVYCTSKESKTTNHTVLNIYIYRSLNGLSCTIKLILQIYHIYTAHSSYVQVRQWVVCQ